MRDCPDTSSTDARPNEIARASCAAPTTTAPPTTVPPATFTDAEVRQFVLETLAAAGAELPNPTISIDASDGYFYSAHVRARLGGQSVDGYEANLTFNQSKRITTASGFATTPALVGAYDLATLQRAVDRLNAKTTTGPNPTVVRLTGVEVGLMMTVSEAAESRWLTPAYVFATESGDSVVAAAAADEYFA